MGLTLPSLSFPGVRALRQAAPRCVLCYFSFLLCVFPMSPLLMNAFPTVSLAFCSPFILFSVLPFFSLCSSISPFISFFLSYSLHFCLREALAYYIICFTMKYLAKTFFSSVATFFSDAEWSPPAPNHYGLFLPFSYIF